MKANHTRPARRGRIHLLGGLLLAASLAASGARAGSGDVVVDPDTGDGIIHLNFHFRFPPSDDEIALVQQQTQRASEILCDATDGQMRIGEMRLSAGGASEPLGDVWYYPPGAINRPSASGPVNSPESRMYLGSGGVDGNGDPSASGSHVRADTFAHELGHMVLRLGDQYDEQRRLGGACGIGRSHETAGLDEQNHSIMEHRGKQVCVTPSDEATTRACFDDADCEPGETCPLPALMSELNVSSNYDLLVGDEFLADDSCPDVRPGTDIRINGFMGETTAIEAIDLTDLDSAKETAALWTAKDFIDSIGDVPAYGEGSAHPVYVFAERTGTQTWTVYIAMEEVHFPNGDEGELSILGTYDLEFEATPSVNVASPGEPTYTHRELIAINGLDPEVFNYSHDVDIENLANGADDAQLVLAFTDLTERDGWNGGTLSSTEINAQGDQQLGECTQTDFCHKRWNTWTERWEAAATTIGQWAGAVEDGLDPDGVTLLSDWELAELRTEASYPGFDLQPPAGLPQAAPHGDCDTPVAFDVTVEGIDQVVLVMDRSGSMNTDRESVGDTRSRLDWAKAGARSFVALQQSTGIEVGLVSFSEDATEDLGLAPVEPDDSMLPGVHLLGDVDDAIDDLVGDGGTAIGDALLSAGDLLAASDTGRTQAVFLLSDGQNNEGATEPDDAAEILRDQGVVVYTLPLGNAADGEILAGIADETGGEMFPSETAFELPPIYATLYARLRGETPIFDRLLFMVEAGFQGELAWEEFTMHVEQGTTRLNFMLSNANLAQGTWSPLYALQSPSGESFGPSIDDPYFQIARVDDPEPGDWTVTILNMTEHDQLSFVWAHAENPLPDCWAGASPLIAEGMPDGGIRIRASSSWGGPLGRGVWYNAQVFGPRAFHQPGQGPFNVPMTLDEDMVTASGTFQNNVGRGRYDVLVTCWALPDLVRYSPGEQADLESVIEQGHPTGFFRQARTSFFLDVPNPPIDTGSVDCDGDGIPDWEEGMFEDTDGDGVTDACDDDSDGDDVPDSDEPTDDADGDGIPGHEDPDSDGDGVMDGVDTCPGVPDRDQADADGDGQGDACECGDQTGGGRLDVSDLLAINQVIFGQSRALMCDVNGDGRCNVSDIISGNAAIFGACQPVCTQSPRPHPSGPPACGLSLTAR